MKIVEWECPDCGFIFESPISEVSSRGFHCKKCSDGISYPNKFIYNALIQIYDKLDFLHREYSPDWCTYKINDKTTYGRYDIYFGFNSKLYIIEMDGGLGHGNRMLDDKTPEQSLLQDCHKESLAIKHNIEVIRIDCDYKKNDRFTYILNNLLSSKLKHILPLELIDFEQANALSQQSVMVRCSELWNKGYSPKDIIDELGVVGSTVSYYLKYGSEIGLTDYEVNKSKYRSNCRKIICITTNEIFDSIVDGSKYYNVCVTTVSRCCRNVYKYAGEFQGQKLEWKYYDEYLNQTA